MATGRLVPSAQARVRSEIEAHYAEAVQTQMDNSSPASAAQAKALADLGDAQAAARRLCVKHLTKKESVYLGWRIKAASSVTWFALSCLLLPAVVFPNLVTLPDDDTRSRLWAAVTIFLSFTQIALAVVALFVAERKTLTAVLRQIILLDTLTLFNLVILALLCGREELHGNGDKFLNILQGLGLSLITAWNFGLPFHLLRLRKKLKSARTDDLPPRDPAAA